MTIAKQIIDDLLSIEVNVVLKPGMTGRKMPEPPYALLDIVFDYDTFLCRHVGALNAAWEASGKAPVRVRAKEERSELEPSSPNRGADSEGMLHSLRTGSVGTAVNEDTFDQLREWAVEAESVFREHGGVDGSVGILFKRIYRNCDQIKGIVSRREVKAILEGSAISRDTATIPRLPLHSDEILIIRKVWDVGTEMILMQTVVQLDGDIITRIQQGRESVSNRALHDLHREAVGSALQHWHFLVETVAAFLTDNIKSFFLH